MADKITFRAITAVVFDIEGTVAPISFVKDTLFPYALDALPTYLSEKWNDKDFRQSHLTAFPAEAQTGPEGLAEHVRDLTRRDVKVASLKNLQGALWRKGYEDGQLVTPLFEDVVPRLKRWRAPNDEGAETRKFAIFSSGSVEAQKMFFGHVGVPAYEEGSGDLLEPDRSGNGDEKTDEKVAAEPHVGDKRSITDVASDSNGDAEPQEKRARLESDDEATDATDADGDGEKQVKKQEKVTEDLQPLFEPYWFDTVNAGNKFDSASYDKIVKELCLGDDASGAEHVLFLSDNGKEIQAALDAGLKAVLIVRPGNPAQDPAEHVLQATSLDEIELVP